MSEMISGETEAGREAQKVLLDLADTCLRIVEGADIDKLDQEHIGRAAASLQRIDNLTAYFKHKHENPVDLTDWDGVFAQAIQYADRKSFLPVKDVLSEIQLAADNPKLAGILGDRARLACTTLAAQPGFYD